MTEPDAVVVHRQALSDAIGWVAALAAKRDGSADEHRARLWASLDPDRSSAGAPAAPATARRASRVGLGATFLSHNEYLKSRPGAQAQGALAKALRRDKRKRDDAAADAADAADATDAAAADAAAAEAAEEDSRVHAATKRRKFATYEEVLARPDPNMDAAERKRLKRKRNRLKKKQRDRES